VGGLMGDDDASLVAIFDLEFAVQPDSVLPD
jgi:hypothetical protein